MPFESRRGSGGQLADAWHGKAQLEWLSSSPEGWLWSVTTDGPDPSQKCWRYPEWHSTNLTKHSSGWSITRRVGSTSCWPGKYTEVISLCFSLFTVPCAVTPSFRSDGMNQSFSSLSVYQFQLGRTCASDASAFWWCGDSCTAICSLFNLVLPPGFYLIVCSVYLC
jgi:hypothetical protein